MTWVSARGERRRERDPTSEQHAQVRFQRKNDANRSYYSQVAIVLLDHGDAEVAVILRVAANGRVRHDGVELEVAAPAVVRYGALAVLVLDIAPPERSCGRALVIPTRLCVLAVGLNTADRGEPGSPGTLRVVPVDALEVLWAAFGLGLARFAGLAAAFQISRGDPFAATAGDSREKEKKDLHDHSAGERKVEKRNRES